MRKKVKKIVKKIVKKKLKSIDSLKNILWGLCRIHVHKRDEEIYGLS